jgi:tetratricopeptide (TPR) repeat protein
MLLPFVLLLQSATLPSFDEVRMRDCLTLAQTDPLSAIVNANEWQKNKGGHLAQACLAAAYMEQGQHAKAAAQYVTAATSATAAKNKIAPALWAQAGYAAFAAGDSAQAQAHLTKALSSGTLQRAARGGALITRARSYVATGQDALGATDLTEARRIMPNDPAAWLLSATLARRGNDLVAAQNHIQTAAALSPSDASVALEAGNIAAAAGAYDIARVQWEQTIRISPQSAQADTAGRLLKQLSAIETKSSMPHAAPPIKPTPKVAVPETR